MSDSDLIPVQRLNAECVCLNTQRAARRIARLFDAAFKPVGLTSGQFTMLGALNQQADVSISDLAAILGMERTTLTRNLAPLEAAGLIASATPKGDRRYRNVALTSGGRARLAEAMPIWHALHRAIAERVDARNWGQARETLSKLG